MYIYLKEDNSLIKEQCRNEPNYSFDMAKQLESTARDHIRQVHSNLPSRTSVTRAA
jgi:hypothetical protein